MQQRQRTHSDRKPQRASGGFVSGVLVLSVSTVLVKIIGLAYKIPMMAKLGSVGMGYFNSAYEVYAILCVVATAGLPVALSMLIASEREKGCGIGVKKIYRASMLVFLLLGVLGSLVLFFFAGPIAKAIGNENAYQSILAISPALLMVCLSGGIRGYFQGYGQMMPTALSQLMEALGKLIFGVWFASLALEQGLPIETVAAYAVLGMTLGTLLSAVYLLMTKGMHRPVIGVEQISEKMRSPLPELLKIAVPITLGSVLITLTRLADMTLMMHRLQDIGYSSLATNSIYGSYTTMAVPVFSLIPALITPITLVLIPQLSGAMERGDTVAQVTLSDDSIRMTVLLAMPASCGIAVFAEPILSLLFAGQSEAVEMAAPLLAALGGSILFSGLITTTNAVLQAYRKPVLPIVSMAVGVLLKIVSAYVLLGIPAVGAYGAPISTFLCNACVTVLNIYFMNRFIPKASHSVGILQLYGKPLAASVIAVALAVMTYVPLGRTTVQPMLRLMLAIGVAVVGYLILILWMKIVTAEDLAKLPRLSSGVSMDKKKGQVKE